jgi:hypothetical protein
MGEEDGRDGGGARVQRFENCGRWQSMRLGELPSKPAMNDLLDSASMPLTLGDYPPSDTVRHGTPVDTRHFTEHYKLAGEDIMASVGEDI